MSELISSQAYIENSVVDSGDTIEPVDDVTYDTNNPDMRIDSSAGMAVPQRPDIILDDADRSSKPLKGAGFDDNFYVGQYNHSLYITDIGDGSEQDEDYWLSARQFYADPEEYDRSFTETIGASWRLDTLTGNWLNREEYDRFAWDKNFVPEDHPFAKEHPELQHLWGYATNESMMEGIVNQATKEREDRQILDEAGAMQSFFASAIAMGLAPENLLMALVPMSKGLTIGQQIAKWSAISGSAEYARELVLYQQQLERTRSEGVTNTMLATVMGGAFAGLGSALSADQLAVFGKSARELLRDSADNTVKESAEAGSESLTKSVGAAEVIDRPEIEDYGINGAFGIEKITGAPLVKIINSSVLESMMFAFDMVSSPFYHTGNFKGKSLAPEGQSVEIRMSLNEADWARQINSVRDDFFNYRGEKQTLLNKMRAAGEEIPAFQSQRLNWTQFKEAVFDEVNMPNSTGIKEVEQAADKFRDFYADWKQKLVDAKMLDEKFLDKDTSQYTNYMYDAVEVQRLEAEFKNDITNMLMGSVSEAQRTLDSTTQKLAKAESSLENLKGEAAQVKAAKDAQAKTAKELKEIKAFQKKQLSDLDKDITARSTIRDQKTGGKKRTEESKAKQAELKSEVKELRAKRQRLKRDLDKRVNDSEVKAKAADKAYKKAVKSEKAIAGVEARVAKLAERKDNNLEAASLTRADVGEAADAIYNNVRGTPLGQTPTQLLPDNFVGKGASLKQRMINMPYEVQKKYLVRDIEVASKSYLQTISPRYELAKMNDGDFMAEAKFKDIQDQYAYLRDEARALGKEKGLSQSQIDKEISKLIAEETSVTKILRGFHERLLGIDADPSDPTDIWRRIGEGVRRLNFVRLLGQMTVSAMPDLARTVMTQGAMPAVKMLQTKLINPDVYKALKDDAMIANIGYEHVTNARTNKWASLNDNMLHTTKLERGLGIMSDGFGKVSLMVPWNDAMKGFAGVVAQENFAKGILARVSGNASKREIRELSKAGISEEMGQRIAAQIDKYGSTKGTHIIPKVDSWDDALARESFAGAITKIADETIVTPSLAEMPFWVSSGAGATIMQFKSFALSSMSRTLVSGLQARDMAALNGFMLSMALGSMVFATKSVIRGDDPTQISAARLGDEAMHNSGMFGWWGDASQPIQQVTGIPLSFSAAAGEQEILSRYQTRGLVGSFGGPTVSLAEEALKGLRATATGEWTEGDKNAIRRLVPYQNLIYFNWLLNRAMKD